MALKFLSRSTLKGEKATAGTTFWSHFSKLGLLRIILRFVQFIFGIAIIGIYAQDLDAARKARAYVDSKWVWAVVCGTLGALVSLVFMLPLVKAWFFFYVDAFVWLCYLIAFGIFGRMFIPEHAEGNKGIERMKAGVWVLLTNMFLWLLSACIGGWIFWRERKARTTHTGRANVHV
ncbi:hypothetical protein ACN47E_004441 [Coniothyrium glycines]